MVVTRSQVGAEEENQQRVFEEPPRSPSVNTAQREEGHTRAVESVRTALQETHVATTSSAAEKERFSTAPRKTAQPPRNEAAERVAHRDASLPGPSVTTGPQTKQRVRVARSNKSTASAVARLQYEAEERLAVIKRRELELEAELIRKKLTADIAALEEEDSGPEETEPTEKIDRVFAWLDESNVETRPVDQPRGEHNLRARQLSPPPRPQPEQHEHDRERRRSSSRSRGIDQIASILEGIAKARPPPRQATDLPRFSGSPLEWLQFSAAMKETTRLYSISPIENIARLRNCLQGEARDSVAPLLNCATHPDVIMKTLEQCYGRPEILVDITLAELKRLPKMGATANELNMFAVKVQNAVAVLQNVKPSYLHNPLLVRDVLEKMHLHLKARWYDFAEAQPGPDADIMKLSSFLMREADRALKFGFAPVTTAISIPASPRREPTRTAPKPEMKKKTVYTATDETPSCPICNQAHTLPSCQKFKQMELNERWEIVKQEGLCFKCIASRHRRYSCRQKACGIKECKRPHHRLLHHEEPRETVVAETVAAMNATSSVKLKICPVTLRGTRGSFKTFALFDEGSTVTLIDDRLARRIGAEGPTVDLSLKGVGHKRQELKSRRVTIEVKGARDEERHKIVAQTMPGLNLSPQSIPKSALQLEHLNGLNMGEVTYEDAKPQLLIGSDNWSLIVTRELRAGTPKQPAASRTELGWVIHGSLPSRWVQRHEQTLHVVTRRPQEDQLEQIIDQHFKIEALGVSLTSTHMRDEDKRAINIFERTVARRGAKYEVGLPWREDEPELPHSYDSALRRLVNLENKLKKNSRDREEYQRQIENLIVKGYAEPCDGSEDRSPVAWYLPHFAVKNPNKPGKLRMVFDAAARARGTSLNDHLLEGPDLLRSLQTILFRFREGTYAITADIEEMFLRIKIRREDQPAQMFLWRNCQQDRSPTKMKMTSMIFGASSSPFLAHSVRNYNAQEHAETHPAALLPITEAHYMDDFVDSFDTREEACEVIKQVDAVQRNAGFVLRGWRSNDRQLLQCIRPEHRAGDVTTPLGGAEKMLGLLWDSSTDCLGFNTALHRVPTEVRDRKRPPTKREALATVMSIYDPLGLLSCYTITAKITLQKLWRIRTGWDESLPEDIAREFDRWLASIDTVRNLQIPRVYHGGRVICRRELHVFCDASEDAYATVGYWLLKYEDGHREAKLVAARARVAPLKTQTVPRLELQAALIGARLAKTIKEEHRAQVDQTTFWTDSQTVLHWIRNGSRRYTPYVAHRIGEITEETEATDWRWVPTHLNIADAATRAGYAICKDDEWFTGPAFLSRPKREWPRNDATEEEPVEVQHVTHALTDNGDAILPEIDRFSNFDRLIASTANVLLFVQKCRDRTAVLTSDLMGKATDLWIQRAQRDSFPAEIENVRKGTAVPKSSPLRRYDVIWEEGMLKLNGRINRADVPLHQKKPILIDGRHRLSRLLIEREHRRAGHANSERVVNNLRQRYWILRLRPTVRAIAAACPMCRLRKRMPRNPPIGDLPIERLQPYERPFSRCGIDYFGPMIVTIGRRKEKRWGALFTCLTTRAVHLELAASLTTDSAIMALRRMAARRGWPAVIYSDNGTNFRGADIELKKAYEEWLPELTRYAMNHETTWKFIAPGAPNQGGAWERLVRSVKTALQATLRERAPKEEILSTLLTEVEHAVNSRPLTHVSVSPDDYEALTPNHFLLGSSIGLPIIGPTSEADRRSWRAAQALADHFWRRWVREYLPTLTPRVGQGRATEFKIGDVVIIADPALPRNMWPRGIVVRTLPGPDGVTRVAEIQTKGGGIFKRPTNKLVPLEVQPAPSPDQWEGTRCTASTVPSSERGCGGTPAPGGGC